MTAAQFPIMWENFSAADVRQLKKLWSAYSFPRHFCNIYCGVISGSPGSPGYLFFEAKNKMRDGMTHHRVPIIFVSLEDLVHQAAEILTKASESFPVPPDPSTVEE